jgi:hypothetical protein
MFTLIDFDFDFIEFYLLMPGWLGVGIAWVLVLK